MSGEKDMQKMAKEFLNLWQQQLNSIMKEPDVAGNMLKTMHDMQRKFFEAEADVTNSKQSAVSEYGDDELLELDRRIRVCEKRLDTLESGLKKKS